MEIVRLRDEIVTDPLARGYAGMSDVDVAASLNTVDRERDRDALTGSEVMNAVDDDEWTLLSDAQRQTIWNLAHLGTINPFGMEARLMQSVFNETDSPTIAVLAAMRKEPVSRAVELGLGWARPGNVAEARK